MYEHEYANNFETEKKICRENPTTNHNVMIWMYEHQYANTKTYNGSRNTNISSPKKPEIE